MLNWLFGEKKKSTSQQFTPGNVKSNMDINTPYGHNDGSKKAKAARHWQYRIQGAIKKSLGDEAYAIYQQWERRSHDGLWITAVVRGAKEAKVVAGRLSGIEDTKGGKLKLFYEPAYTKFDRSIGIDIVDFRDSLRSITLDRMVWHELHREFAIEDVRGFNKAMVKAAAQARRF